MQLKSTEVCNLTGDPALDGDESHAIVVCGRLYGIGLRTVHWWDPGGGDGYDEHRVALPATVDRRTGQETPHVIAGKRYSPGRVPGHITQFLVHHSGGDGAGCGRIFDVLHNQRGLSVQFATDDDGTTWQFIDAVECAWHAGHANGCSVGVEAALFAVAQGPAWANPDPYFYSSDHNARNGNQPHNKGVERIQGTQMTTYQMPAGQVSALARLAAGTWAALHIETGAPQFVTAPHFPRDAAGAIPREVIADPLHHVGLIGHLHHTQQKIDPCGFPWEAFEVAVGALHAQFLLHGCPPT